MERKVNSSDFERGYSLSDFEYELPPELIAQKPLDVRHSSRLMHVDRASGSVSNYHFSDIVKLLRAGDLLVLNDTRVIPARLFARRQSGAHIEILLLRPQTQNSGLWEALATPLKKLHTGETIYVDLDSRTFPVEVVDIFQAADGHRRALLNLGDPETVFDLLNRRGYAPLPPYIHRDDNEQLRTEDLERYQTVFARAPGAVAAPTAGLHFSPQIFEQLNAAGVQHCFLTLHVGPGTFKPISGELSRHYIEPERFSITPAVAQEVNQALADGRRVIAVGTTSCRALETAGTSGRLQPVEDGSADLFIQPGFEFRIVKGLITNFHLSRSSLLVLVSTFGGHPLIKHAYREAVDQRYRFYSYGDSMFIS